MTRNYFLNSFANLLSGVCHDFEIELHLPPLQVETFCIWGATTDDDAWLDIKVNWFWESKLNKTYLDAKLWCKNFQSATKILPKSIWLEVL